MSGNNQAFDCYVVSIVEKSGAKFFFRGLDVAKCLNYVRPHKAVIDHVQPEWKMTWKKLKIFILAKSFKPPKNWQPHSVFVNEAGLWSLIMKSKMSQAVVFQKWMFEDVLPSLRKNYQLNTFKKYFFKKYNIHEIKMMEEKQKNGFVYWATTKEYFQRGIIKIGCTSNIERRLGQLNSSTIDRFYILANFSVLNKYKAEKLVHEICKPYHLTKEFYKIDGITSKKIEEIMEMCKNSKIELFVT